jgi:hypothetical protein
VNRLCFLGVFVLTYLPFIGGASWADPLDTWTVRYQLPPQPRVEGQRDGSFAFLWFTHYWAKMLSGGWTH